MNTPKSATGIKNTDAEIRRALSLITGSVSEIASVYDSGDIHSKKAYDFETFIDAPEGASIFDNANLTAAKGASIFDNANLTVANIVAILEHVNLTATKANSICDHANLTSDREQAILYQMITDDDFNKLIDIITDGQSDVTISANTQIEDTTIYKDLTVDAGKTLTLHTAADSKSGILIARTITNNGTITRTEQGAAGGAAGVAGAGAGVKGGGGLLIVVKTLDNNNIISAPGLVGINASTVAATGPGTAGTAGAAYRIGTDTFGGGGTLGRGGYECHMAACSGGGGGADRGGGGGHDNGGGSGGTATYTTITATELHDLLLQATVDYFIETVEGKAAPSTPQAFIDVYNSGSGGGGARDNSCAGGAGGGGGGEIILACDTYDNTGGNIKADAGAGGDGGTEGAGDSGGGGGSGGIVYVLYATQIAAGTLSAAIGAGGFSEGDWGANAGGVGPTSAIDITA